MIIMGVEVEVEVEVEDGHECISSSRLTPAVTHREGSKPKVSGCVTERERDKV